MITDDVAGFDSRLGRTGQQQGERSLEAGMELGWQLLRSLPAAELHRLNDRQIEQYILGDTETAAMK